MEDQLVPYRAHAGLESRSLLVFAPHPDDEVFGCGGTLATHAARGDHVQVIVLTDGAWALEGEARLRHTEVREAESRAAAAVLGCPSPVFWRLPDRGVCAGPALVGRLAQAIADSGADMVCGTSLREMHPDHWHLATALVAAVKLVARPGLRLAGYEVGVPLTPNYLCDITPQVAVKQAAMHCFASQLLNQCYDEHMLALNRYRSFTLTPEVRFVEAFHVVDSLALQDGSADGCETVLQRRHRLGTLYPIDGRGA